MDAVTTKFVISDISLAAYCRMRGMTLKTAKRINRRFQFEFDEAVEVGKKMKVDFVNSEAYQYDHAMRGVKSLLYSETEEGT